MNTDAKILDKILGNQMQQHVKKKDNTPHSTWIHPMVTRMAQHMPINVIYHVNKRKIKTHITISTDSEKAFE